MTSNKEFSGRDYVYTPDLSGKAYVQYIQELVNAPTIAWGCKSMDNRRVTPMRPGEITTVIARPGNGKTSFLVYMARKEAQRCDFDKGECVVYVSWEEPVESIEMSIQSGNNYTSEQVAFGEIDPATVIKESIKRVKLPLITLGKSMILDRGKRKPPMYISKVYDAIRSLYNDKGLKPTLICADYLQKIPVSSKRNRMDEVTEAMFGLSELAIDVECPILLAAQATREVDKQGLPIPTLDGAQWSSAIEQESFRMLGLLRPITIGNKEGKPLDYIKIRGKEYEINKYLMILRLIKQRKFFPDVQTYPVHFNPGELILGDLDAVTGNYIPPTNSNSPIRGETEVKVVA